MGSLSATRCRGVCAESSREGNAAAPYLEPRIPIRATLAHVDISQPSRGLRVRLVRPTDAVIPQALTGHPAQLAFSNRVRLLHDDLRGLPQHEPPSAVTGAALWSRSPSKSGGTAASRAARSVRIASRVPATGCYPEATVLEHVNRCWDHLFGHALARDTETRLVAGVERTNNPVEHFFLQAQRELGRRMGRAHLGRDMQDQPAQVALTANLRDPDYVRILCGTLDGLSGAFTDLVQSGQATARPALCRYARNSVVRCRVCQWSWDSAN